MSSGRSRMRGQMLRRGTMVAGALVLLTLLFFATGHWVLGAIFGIAAGAAVWALLQARSVR